MDNTIGMSVDEEDVGMSIDEVIDEFWSTIAMTEGGIVDIDERVKRFGKIATTKYETFEKEFKLPDRTWPDKDIEKAPIWCSVDLRDGNQSLENPMSIEKKLIFFKILVWMGYKEIEVGFPASSTPDYDFIRKIIEEDLIPKDVKIQVLASCKEDIIKKTRECVEGAKNVIVHFYNPTSENQMKDVYENNEEETIEMAVNGMKWVREYFGDFGGKVQVEYSPESFTQTKIRYALEVCKNIIDEFEYTVGESEVFEGQKLIFNLPATVEVSTPDRYADRIEYIKRELKYYIEETKKKIDFIISTHPHNDRGGAVTAAELAMKAGAERVEGVTGVPNGERTGNVDIMTLCLNMFSNKVDPGLDFSKAGEIAYKISKIIGLPVPDRYPYVGKFVHTAFSGGHQFAIGKGLNAQKVREEKGDKNWKVPYLPIDPKDIGLEYEPIQINSQSGKSGSAFVLENLGYKIPKKMRSCVGKIIQKFTEKKGGALTKDEMKSIFEKNFVNVNGVIPIDKIDQTTTSSIKEFSDKISEEYGIDFILVDYSERTQAPGRESNAITYVEIEYKGKRYFGIGIDGDFRVSGIKGVITTLNVALKETKENV